MKYQNTQADRFGAHPQYAVLSRLTGKTVEVTDISGKGAVTITGALKGGKSPYDNFVVISNDQIQYSFRHYDVSEISGGEITIE